MTVLSINNPYSPNCDDVKIELHLEGLTPNVGDDLYFSFTVTQDGATQTFDGSSGTPMTLPPADADGKNDLFQPFSSSLQLLTWLDGSKPFDIYVDAKLSFTDTSGVRSETVSVSGCNSPTITARKPGGSFAPIGGGGGPSAVPTLGGAGLAFTALALPAFAAPALRRRKKQGKKADTLR